MPTTAKAKAKGKSKSKIKGKAKGVAKVRQFELRGEENLPNSASTFSLTHFLGATSSKKRVNVFVEALFGSKIFETVRQCFR